MATVQEPVCVADLEDYARKHLPKHAFEYFAGGANDETTLRENVEALKRCEGLRVPNIQV